MGITEILIRQAQEEITKAQEERLKERKKHRPQYATTRFFCWKNSGYFGATANQYFSSFHGIRRRKVTFSTSLNGHIGQRHPKRCPFFPLAFTLNLTPQYFHIFFNNRKS